MEIKLSVCLITLNEEKYLEKCLRSVSGIADEIIVVDSGSKDNTIAIAKKYNARIFERKFDTYANQKNYANSKAEGSWVLSLDGDELIEKDLAGEISKAIQDDTYAAYTMPRKNIILGKFIRYTRWQPELDRHIWLFRKDKSEWVGDVHEEVQVKGKVGKLKFAKVHYQYETISEFFDMMDRYSSLEAKERNGRNEKYSLFKLIYLPICNFLVRYFYRLGFLDGIQGFILSMLMAIYHYEVVVKMWEIEKKA